jgi:hypothetical protein
MRTLGIGFGEKKNEIGPLTPQQIKQLPLVLFIPAPINTPELLPPTTPSVVREPDPPGFKAEGSAAPRPNEIGWTFTASNTVITPPSANPVFLERPTIPFPQPAVPVETRFGRLFKYRRSKSTSSTSKLESNGDNSTESNHGYVKPPGKLRYHHVEEHLATCSICLLGSSISFLRYSFPFFD